MVVKRMRKIPKGAIAMGVQTMYDNIELTVTPHDDDDSQYVVREANGDPVVSYVPEAMWDLIGYMVARRLMEQGLDPDRHLVIRLAGADFVMMHCTLGQAAATPLINFNAPVHEPASVVYKRPHYVG